jgi:hypothetical protein
MLQTACTSTEADEVAMLSLLSLPHVSSHITAGGAFHSSASLSLRRLADVSDLDIKRFQVPSIVWRLIQILDVMAACTRLL